MKVMKLNLFLLAITLLVTLVRAEDTAETKDTKESYGEGVLNQAAAWMLTEDYWKPGDTDWLLTVFFYVNIVWYLLYCDFMASRTF